MDKEKEIKELMKEMAEVIGGRHGHEWMKKAEEVVHREGIKGIVSEVKELGRAIQGGAIIGDEKRIREAKEYIEGAKRELGKIRERIDKGYRWGEEIDGVRERIEKLLIQDKRPPYGIIPLEFNECQSELWKYIREQYVEEGRTIIVVPKSRQWGCSTVVEGMIYDFCVNNEDIRAMVVAQERGTALHLLGMCERFLTEGEAEVETTRKNDNFIKFKESESQINIGTADTVQVGRGKTIHAFHGSEVPYWRDPGVLYKAIDAAISHAKIIVLESTARTTNDFFHRKFKEAIDPEIFSEFKGIFIGWNRDRNCRMEFRDFKDESKFFMSLSDEERRMKEDGFELEQLYWRRTKIQSHDGDLDSFHHEWPLTATEAFSSSVLNAFGQKARDQIRAMLAANKKAEPEWRGEIEYVGTGDGIGWRRRYKLTGDALKGRFKVWREPEEGKQYILGVDVSQGRGTTINDPDYSVVWVLERDTGRHAAMWRSRRADRPYFAKVCLAIGSYYHMETLPAMLAIEITGGWGLPILDAAVECFYPNIYEREVFDNQVGKFTKKLGWTTTPATKPLMIQNLDEFLGEGWLRSKDKDFLEELSYFENYDGKLQAAKGCHDDTVMAAAIASTVHRNMPQIQKEKEKEEDFRNVLMREIQEAKSRTRKRPGYSYSRCVLDTDGQIVKKNFSISE